MATLLSPTIITREALRYLHANLNFIGTINKQYDNQFANSGASPSGRIGPTLTIRNPNRAVVRSGATYSAQTITETSQTLTVATQKGVDFTFLNTELTLTIDEFGPRYLQPFMARLASEIEADALTMIKDVYNFVDNDTFPISFLNYMQGKQKLDEFLAPDDNRRVALLPPTHYTKFADATKGLFNPQEQLGQTFVKGRIGKTANMTFYENTLLTNQLTGSAAKVTTYTVNGAGQTGSVVIVAVGATTFKKGDIVTFVGSNAVHPETKADYGYLQTFTITADYAGGAGNLPISPAIVVTGSGQNVTASPTNGGAVVKVGAGANGLYTQSLVYHPDAFTFVTADLIDVSKFGAWGTVQRMDNISMSIARQLDFANYQVPCRIDVLYGFKCIRPELAARLHANG